MTPPPRILAPCLGCGTPTHLTVCRACSDRDAVWRDKPVEDERLPVGVEPTTSPSRVLHVPAGSVDPCTPTPAAADTDNTTEKVEP